MWSGSMTVGVNDGWRQTVPESLFCTRVYAYTEDQALRRYGLTAKNPGNKILRSPVGVREGSRGRVEGLELDLRALRQCIVALCE